MEAKETNTEDNLGDAAENPGG